ncbi:taurine ABC transporter substrate-binding protein [Pseudomonas palleroniana]|uniref:Taurine ABC transporter substrate-binding protein n=1 Tax=Pseudomonas palleroniana TaxID=191390 RepID=A0A2L1J5S6_9PSED|nr:ABC transporter substrate-binding protein [Pseudomonas palleroniana]AVE03801.1 taurine ABC transporter substrate-binding protein [Pseudomonas palleroniana]
MTQSQPLTIALANFDRHLPFFLGWLPPAQGFHLKALDVGMSPPGRDGGDRHGRMLRDQEFDIAEVSLASYILAKARGSAFTAVPVFPRRLFSANHIYVNARSGIQTPGDLRGRRVAIRGWQVSLSVLAKGDLKSRHGVDWQDIDWVTQDAEKIAFADPRIRLCRMPKGTSGAQLLLSGEVDAFIDPKPPKAVLEGQGGVRNLFTDQRQECLDYFQERQCFPAMHVLAIRDEVVQRFPELPGYLMQAWDDAQAKTRQVYEDYAYTSMPLGRLAWEQSQRDFGDELFPAGLAANRNNLRWFIDYLVDQLLLPEPIEIDRLFHASVLRN